MTYYRLRAQYIGAADEDNIALTVSYGIRGLELPVNIAYAEVIRSVSKDKLPIYLRAGSVIPYATSEDTYIVPPGGLILDRSEYNSPLLPTSLSDVDDLLQNPIDYIFDRLLHTTITAYYRPLTSPQTQVAAAAAAAAEVELAGFAYKLPAGFFATDKPTDTVRIAEVDRFEGIACLSFAMGFIRCLPRDMQDGDIDPYTLTHDTYWYPDNYNNGSRLYALTDAMSGCPTPAVMSVYIAEIINGAVVERTTIPTDALYADSGGLCVRRNDWEGYIADYHVICTSGYAGWLSGTAELDSVISIDVGIVPDSIVAVPIVTMSDGIPRQIPKLLQNILTPDLRLDSLYRHQVERNMRGDKSIMDIDGQQLADIDEEVIIDA